jgi:7-cyano-7-deazaguanine synthase in queuosine biosynthesis
MKVSIIISKAQKGEFSKIKLGYTGPDDNEILVPLNIEFENLYKITKQKNGLTFDLFLLGCYVYGIDILLLRKEFSINGWTRDIDVEFPVESPEIFEAGKDDLERLLSFLTGDNWKISFIKRDIKILYILKARGKVFTDEYRKSFNKISLFSGGLDSLVGVINQLSNSKNKLVLVSHYDSIFKGAKSDQDKVHRILLRKYPRRYHLIQTRVDLSGNDSSGNEINTETTLRARSFLFLCQAVFVAHSIGDSLQILIPENGTISLNHPLTPSRRSSCSSRTAHPYYLNKYVDFISNLGLNHSIKNDYETKTKGEMLEECNDRETLLETYKNTCSCAKRGTRKDIRDIMTGTNHCGICMPCIYRRVALHKINLDDEIVGTNILNPKKYPLEKLPDVPAFLDFMKKIFKVEDIEKNLLVNGSLPLNKVEEYANVVIRTRTEIKEWISDKGSIEIKKILGIR